MKIILLINVKMPTIVGVLTFISRVKIQHLSVLLQEKYFFGILVYMSGLIFMLS